MDRAASEIHDQLIASGQRRKRAEADLGDAREKIAALLIAGKKAGLPVSRMADSAQISRETAHKLLREGK